MAPPIRIRAYSLLILCSCAPEAAPDPLDAFAYLKEGEVWLGDSPAAQHQALIAQDGDFDHALWTADGAFLVVTTRWSGVRLDGENQPEPIGSGSCYGSRGISDVAVEGDLLLYTDQGYEPVGENGDPTWCSNVVHVPSGERLRSGRGLGGTSDGERRFLTCSTLGDVTRASLLDLRTGERLWQAEFESCPTLSPGGAHLAFTEGARTVIQPIDLSQPPVHIIDRAQRLYWSPSGHAMRLSERVVTAQSQYRKQSKPMWLLIEWPERDENPMNYVISNLSEKMPLEEMLNICGNRWRIERSYQDLKGQLGLDHYEGRSFVGWHHHVSVALVCYAFLVAERARSFSPSGTITHAGRALKDAA